MSGAPMKGGPGMARDRYGFFFWLRWIVWFAGSFVVSAGAWTLLLKAVFGPVRGAELTLAWTVAVFGTWFILVIPFMRKKEQIWKRLNDDQEKAVDAWLFGVGVFIGTLVASAFGWSLVFEKNLHRDIPGMDGGWAKAVFGTWIAVLIPFLVLMYRKADAIFQTANARQTYRPGYRRQSVPLEDRLLPEALAKKLQSAKSPLPNGHLVNLTLKNGGTVPYVFVMRGREVVGIYDRTDFGLRMDDIAAVDPWEGELPLFEEGRWLRVDINSQTIE